MSVYSNKTKGWRYDFVLKGKRYSAAGFKTKRDAVRAEAKKREEIELAMGQPETTDMVFLDLVNLRLDHVKAYNSERHYKEYVYCAKRWVAEWGEYPCSEITEAMIQKFLLLRRKVSAYTANKEIRYLKATFNYGLKRRYCECNPMNTMCFFPEEKKLKWIPSMEQVREVIEVASADDQDYLWTIHDTMARVSEVNSLTWNEVNLEQRYIVLYTRKKRGGHRLPRKVPMTKRLHAIMTRRLAHRDANKPWVFWHRYKSKKSQAWEEGPYQQRKHLMHSLCKKAGVPPFGFHALRHAGASFLDASNVPIGTIQRLLGHENRTTTEIYLHSVGSAEREAMLVFETAHEKVPHQVPHQRERGQRHGL